MEKSKRSSARGFTLVELIVVVVILGLLVGIVGPQVWDRLGQSKARIAKIQIEQMSPALSMFRFDVGRYPTTAEGLQALVENPGLDNWNGPYLEKRVPMDPWDRAYEYRSPGQHRDFDLWSWGADGVQGGEDDNADVVSWE